MAGIYVHIPFCHRKCPYCNFFSVASVSLREGFTASLLSEIRLRSHELQDRSVETVYLGGGTPSLMGFPDLRLILDAIREHFRISPEAEITLEANPDDIGGFPDEAFAQIGINRVSLGVQSFHDEDLAYLNRTHDAETSFRAAGKLLNLAGIRLSIDLIYGIPGLTRAKWSENMRITASLGIPHLSAYWLTVEPGTALDILVRRGKLPGPDEEEGLGHLRLLQEWAAANGYEHYEISNLCRPGHRSRHNTAYWNGVPYLGLGPSAHSYDGQTRMWNASSLKEYRESLARGILPQEREFLSPQMRYCELVMTSLRTSDGIDLETVNSRFGEKVRQTCLEAALPHLDAGWLFREDNRLILSRDGMVLADRITSDLFIDPQEWEKYPAPGPVTG